ncbi:hypothetical protein ACJRPK_16040 [Aquimarina sp. 2-A2]|uniref:hypothetical protein n=1 Tax=Aquimarina sp. 2-A2 TaxID=3382644 RepID=UPI00387EFAB9
MSIFKLSYKTSVLFVLLVLGTQHFTFGQTKEATHEVKVISRPQEDRILLRWVANTPISWIKGNRYGYTLERYTISRDRKTLPKPEKIIVGQNFKPVPMMEWESLSEINDFGATMAQALWGESFVVQGGGGLASIINKAEETQQRFAFGLYAADQDFNIAQKAGLGYIDTAVKPNEKYLYKVIANTPTTELKIKEGGVFTGIIDYEPLPEPVDFVGIFQDNSTLLSWNSTLLKNTYNSYIIERSEDGERFSKLGDLPYTAIQKEKSENDRTIYIDSIPNDKAYFYRIKGVSSFGEVGPISNVVTGEGKKVLKFVPHLLSKTFKSESEVELTWEFPEEGNADIKGFTLKRSDTDRGAYIPVVENIPPTARKISYTKLRASNYFKITANGKNNNYRDSFTMLVQPVDSIPPAKPQKLEGRVDSTGVVTLQWKANNEEDLLGYRVFRGNLAKEEFSQLTQSPQMNPTYVDTVNIKSLNSKVFYKIVAVDQRYNLSPASEVLVLKKPDIIPPTPPVFKTFTTDKGTVELSWANSSSDDVAAHYIYRKQLSDPTWQLVFQAADLTDRSYEDTNVEEGNSYSYIIIARDESGLESQPGSPVSLRVSSTGPKNSIRGLYGAINTFDKSIVLSWGAKGEQITSYELYRKVNDAPLTLYKVLPKGSKLFTDTKLTINSTYTYRIRAIFEDGSYSKWSSVEVNY